MMRVHNVYVAAIACYRMTWSWCIVCSLNCSSNFLKSCLLCVHFTILLYKCMFTLDLRFAHFCSFFSYYIKDKVLVDDRNIPTVLWLWFQVQVESNYFDWMTWWPWFLLAILIFLLALLGILLLLCCASRFVNPSHLSCRLMPHN